MSVGVLYADDPGVWHERLLIHPGEKDTGEWMILTPDGDSYVEALLCPGGDAGPERAFLCNVDGDGPDDVAGIFYRFKHYPDQSAVDRRISEASSYFGSSCEVVPVPGRMLLMNGEWTDELPWDRHRLLHQGLTPAANKKKPPPPRSLLTLQAENGKEPCATMLLRKLGRKMWCSLPIVSRPSTFRCRHLRRRERHQARHRPVSWHVARRSWPLAAERFPHRHLAALESMLGKGFPKELVEALLGKEEGKLEKFRVVPHWQAGVRNHLP